MLSNFTQVRIIYADTDAMGIVYHTNYIRWFELGRNELMRQLGVSYTELEKLGLNLPLTKVSCHYLAPAKYDQLVTVETAFDYIKRASIKFNSKIWDENRQKLHAEGYTIHACTNREGKIRRMPQVIVDLANKYDIKKGEEYGR
ncbi:MAG: thioesterase family protein [Smithellaceae bacterium]|nr:acyl-CoA thioesterase [Syntrophaceae bacterium]MDD4240086.1 thioesterase family protein [Smithellaceae bacterium]NLX51450.1 acyl-CoA thioesterase [Deltaproteobacteria bacterium]